jgi:hypothetical protein
MFFKSFPVGTVADDYTSDKSKCHGSAFELPDMVFFRTNSRERGRTKGWEK